MKNYIITLLLLAIMIGSASAQQLTGLIDLKDLGVQFTIPNGWFGQEAEAALVLGSNTEVGLILMMQHEYSTIAEIKAEADAGLVEDGIMLQRSGNYETIGTNGIGAEFSGRIQGAQAKAYIASLVNPHGAGITIMSMTESDKFSARYRELAHLIAKSVKFSKPVVPPVVNEWKEALQDTRLSYLSSYSSGSSGGSSSSVYIHLCRAGYFKYSSSSSLSIDTGGAFGYSGGSGQGNGRWDVLSDGQGGAMLVLYFEDGSTNEYRLSFQDGKTFLNGNRYFKTGKNDPNYPADCP